MKHYDTSGRPYDDIAYNVSRELLPFWKACLSIEGSGRKTFVGTLKQHLQADKMVKQRGLLSINIVHL